GIRLAIEKQHWRGQFAFSLAVLSKETAIITPLALALWEVLNRDHRSAKDRVTDAGIYLVPLLPLFAWLGYHHHVTGRFFGSAEFYQYNVTQAVTPVRFVLAFGLR